MDVNLKVTGIDEVRVALRHAAFKVGDAARKQMHRSADKIVVEARINTPVDEGNLEESIHKEIGYEGPRGRLKIDVVAGGVVNGVDVDQYAMKIHEHYESMKPGPNSLAKMAQYPGRVGSHFLTRAADMVQPRLMESMISLIKSLWTGKL